MQSFVISNETISKVMHLLAKHFFLEFLGRFRIFENRPLDPVLSLRVISEKKKSKYVKQKFEKIV